MITIKIAKKSDLNEFAKLRFLAHQYSAKFDKEVVITSNSGAELARLVKKEFEDILKKTVTDSAFYQELCNEQKAVSGYYGNLDGLASERMSNLFDQISGNHAF